MTNDTRRQRTRNAEKGQGYKVNNENDLLTVCDHLIWRIIMIVIIKITNVTHFNQHKQRLRKAQKHMVTQQDAHTDLVVYMRIYYTFILT